MTTLESEDQCEPHTTGSMADEAWLRVLSEDKRAGVLGGGALGTIIVHVKSFHEENQDEPGEMAQLFDIQYPLGNSQLP